MTHGNGSPSRRKRHDVLRCHHDKRSAQACSSCTSWRTAAVPPLPPMLPPSPKARRHDRTASASSWKRSECTSYCWPPKGNTTCGRVEEAAYGRAAVAARRRQRRPLAGHNPELLCAARLQLASLHVLDQALGRHGGSGWLLQCSRPALSCAAHTQEGARAFAVQQGRCREGRAVPPRWHGAALLRDPALSALSASSNYSWIVEPALLSWVATGAKRRQIGSWQVGTKAESGS